MKQARAFSFDTEFAPDGAIVREGKKRLSPEEIEAECAQAYERGKADAYAAAERDVAAQMQTLASAASAILARLGAESRSMREEALLVAMAAARKISGAALDAFGAETTLSALEAAMDALRAQPRLLVRLAPAAAETLRPRIGDLCAAHGYAGAVLVRADENIKQGAVSIDWTDGLVTHDPQAIAARVEDLIAAALASRQAPP